MNVLFDSMGVQVQVQEETGDRLTDYYAALKTAGCTLSFTDYTLPISSQLDGIDVLVITTHQIYPFLSKTTPPIPLGTCFGFSTTDLQGIPEWVSSNGGGVLLFTNHGNFPGDPLYFPVNDIQLAAAFGVTTVFASFAGPGKTLTFTPPSPVPATIAPIVSGVSTVEALDSGGIAPGNGTVILPLPSDCTDRSGLGYSPSDYAFAVLYPYGKGNVIVLGHSGFAANCGTPLPSEGQFCDADNKTFLVNCVTFLGGGS